MDKLKESIWNCLVGADGVSCSIESITVSKGLTDLMYVDAATGNYCGAVISRQLTIENIRRKH